MHGIAIACLQVLCLVSFLPIGVSSYDSARKQKRLRDSGCIRDEDNLLSEYHTKYIRRRKYNGATYLCPVGDITPPEVHNCPANIIVTTSSPTGMRVFWNTPNASNSVVMTNSHNPNDTFSIGNHTVIYVFQDRAGNTDICSFNVEVKNKVLDTPIIPWFVSDPSPCDCKAYFIEKVHRGSLDYVVMAETCDNPELACHDGVVKILSYGNNQSDDWHNLTSFSIPCLRRIYVKDTSHHLLILGVALTYNQGLPDPPSILYQMDYSNHTVELVQELPSAHDASWWDDILVLLPITPVYTGTQPVKIYSRGSDRYELRKVVELMDKDYTVSHHIRINSWDCLVLAEAEPLPTTMPKPTDIYRVDHNFDLVLVKHLNVALLSFSGMDSIQYSDFTLLTITVISGLGSSPVRMFKLTKNSNKILTEELNMTFSMNYGQQYHLCKFIMHDEEPHMILGSINEETLLVRFESDHYEYVQKLAMNSTSGAIHIQNGLLVLVKAERPNYLTLVPGPDKMVFTLP